VTAEPSGWWDEDVAYPTPDPDVAHIEAPPPSEQRKRTAEQDRRARERAEQAEPVPMKPTRGEVEEWKNPEPLTRRADPLPFPVASLPDWVRTFVEAEAEATQTPPDMAAMFALGALATVCAGYAEVEPRPGWREPLSLYLAVVMDPGSRKSAVHRDATGPVSQRERDLLEAAIPEQAEMESLRKVAEGVLTKAEKALADARSRPLDEKATAEQRDKRAEEEEALEAEMRTAAVALARMDAPISRRLSTSDATPERLATLLGEAGDRFAYISAEGGIFDIIGGRYSKGIPNLDIYLKGYSGDPHTVDRQGKPPLVIERPLLTVCLAVQPYVLTVLGQRDVFMGRGLLDRFLYAVPTGNVGHRSTEPEPMDPAALAAWDAGLLAVAEKVAGAAVTLTLDRDAYSTFGTFMAEMEPRRRPERDLGWLQGWASKLDGAVARIAGLLHIAGTYAKDWRVPIDPETVTEAIAIGHYLIAHAEAAFDEMGGDVTHTRARRVVGWLQKGRRERFTKREVHNAHRSLFREAKDVDPVLDLLADHHYIRRLPRPEGPGRPSEPWAVHPRLYQDL
jgi:hypothetical protein